jgi:hypothetical protein
MYNLLGELEISNELLTRERSLCRRFAASDLYLFNWAGVADFNFFVIASIFAAAFVIGFFTAAAQHPILS